MSHRLHSSDHDVTVSTLACFLLQRILNPTTLDHRHDKAARCLRRKPLQVYADIEGNVGTEDNNGNTSRECWITRDGKLYTTVTGPLARSSRYKWETSSGFIFSGEGFALYSAGFN